MKGEVTMVTENLKRRMTWEEIQSAFPYQNVGLIECYPNKFSIESAIVKYSEQDISYDEMVEKALEGEITMMFTALNKCVVLKQ